MSGHLRNVPPQPLGIGRVTMVKRTLKFATRAVARPGGLMFGAALSVLAHAQSPIQQFDTRPAPAATQAARPNLTSEELVAAPLVGDVRLPNVTSSELAARSIDSIGFGRAPTGDGATTFNLLPSVMV